MLLDKSFGLIKLTIHENEKKPSVEVVKEPEARHEQIKKGDVLVKTEARLTGRQDSLIKNGHQTSTTYVVKLNNGKDEDVIALVDIVDPLATESKEKIDNVAFDLFSLRALGKLGFGEVIERANEQNHKYIITSVEVTV